MRQNNISPQLKTYYEIRWDRLLEELRELSSVLGRQYPVPSKEQRIWLEQNASSNQVDVIGAK